MSPVIETDSMKEARKRKQEFKELSKKKLHFYNGEPSKEAHNYMISLCEAANKRVEELDDYSDGLQEAVQALSERLQETEKREDDADKAHQTLSDLFIEQRDELDKYRNIEKRLGNDQGIFNKNVTFGYCLLASTGLFGAVYAAYEVYANYPAIKQLIFEFLD